jgi:hypothetical protein
MFEDLKLLEQQLAFTVQFCNIDSDPHLLNRFKTRIPVLATAAGDKIICEQKLDRQALTDYLLAMCG